MSVNIDGIVYCTREEVRASKQACASFSSSVAKDVLGFGVRVNTVSPGATLAPMMAQFFPDGTSEEAIKELGMYLVEPSDIARAIVYLLSEESDKISGVNLPVGSDHSLA